MRADRMEASNHHGLELHEKDHVCPGCNVLLACAFDFSSVAAVLGAIATTAAATTAMTAATTTIAAGTATVRLSAPAEGYRQIVTRNCSGCNDYYVDSVDYKLLSFIIKRLHRGRGRCGSARLAIKRCEGGALDKTIQEKQGSPLPIRQECRYARRQRRDAPTDRPCATRSVKDETLRQCRRCRCCR